MKQQHIISTDRMFSEIVGQQVSSHPARAIELFRNKNDQFKGVKLYAKNFNDYHNMIQDLEDWEPEEGDWFERDMKIING